MNVCRLMIINYLRKLLDSFSRCTAYNLKMLRFWLHFLMEILGSVLTIFKKSFRIVIQYS